jgi:hypothetical protein
VSPINLNSYDSHPRVLSIFRNSILLGIAIFTNNPLENPKSDGRLVPNRSHAYLKPIVTSSSCAGGVVRRPHKRKSRAIRSVPRQSNRSAAGSNIS